MEYTYATCLLSETGEEINEENLTAVLEAAGSPVQESRVKAIVAALEDIQVEGITGPQPGTGSGGTELSQQTDTEQLESNSTDEE